MLKLSEKYAQVGHWRLNFADDQLFWSEQTFKIYGLPFGQPPNLEEAIEAFHPEDRSAIANAVEVARTTGTPYQFRARLFRSDGSLRFTESVAQVEFDLEGNPIAIFGTFADRTSDEEAICKIERARNSAQIAGDAKSAFLARMSHEIRTPMNAIVGFADLLLIDGLTDEQKRKAHVIATSGRTLTRMLNDILDLSKIEAGHISIAEGPLDIRSVVEEIVDLYSAQAAGKGIVIKSRLGVSLPRAINGDELRTRQILSNLLSNAVKFTDFGTVEIDVFSKDDRLFIEVHDTGIGMDPDFKAQCFDPFSQFHRDNADSRGGTGLGLAICQQLVSSMSGRLSVRSQLERGSSFLVELPLSVVDEEPERTVTAPTVQSCRGARVLLAEDFDINQMLISAMAEELSINLEVVDDGRMAVEAVSAAKSRGEPFQLVLMDLQMPEVDGYEASRILRAQGFSERELPILALSANAFPDDIRACLNAGMQGHIAKPVEFDAFAERIAEVLGMVGVETSEYGRPTAA